MDCWQTALEDVGPAGVDKGAGGKYLILPPGYDQPLPDGYSAFPSDVYQGYGAVALESSRAVTQAVAKAVEYGKRIKLYPLSAGGQSTRDDVHRCRRPDVRRRRSPTTFGSSNRSTAWCRASRGSRATALAINMLRSLGIEKGKPFAPDAADEGDR